MLSCLLVVVLSVSCATRRIESTDIQKNELRNIFENFWQISKKNIYPKKLEAKYFTETEYEKLIQLSKSAKNIYEFSFQLNDFLQKLAVSHTYFYTDRDLDFYFFRSLFSTRDLDQPTLWHIGAEYKKTNYGYIVRSVLDGLSADKSDLKRGDLILKADGRSFHPVESFLLTKGDPVKLLVKRNSKQLKISITPHHSGLHRSYIEAIRKSVRVIRINNKKIGYVHLWTGTHNESVAALKSSVLDLQDTDGLILDLRDGYGGAWWDHLDSFYPNTKSYFKATWLDRDGTKSEMLPEIKNNNDVYIKPMAVLINEGVRSGKEALAFQFKKTKRATLIGTRTAGYFVAGGAYFRELELPHFLYLSSKGLLLDGVDLEGSGVEPDMHVPYPLVPGSTDTQLKAAIRVLSKN
jgi:carboxyl-terminal processing protease